MAEYIEREKVYDMLNAIGGCGAAPDTWADGWDKAIDTAIEELDKLPAADVQEVKHGFWEEGKVRGQFALICSKCKCDAGVIYDYDCCPSCGAKMDGKDDKNECKTI